MKFSSFLLSIVLSAVAKSTVAIHESNDIKVVEMSLDLAVIEKNYDLARARGINVGHSAVEFHPGLRSRSDNLKCLEDCGAFDIVNCNGLFNELNAINSSVVYSAPENGNSVEFSVNDCMFSLLSFGDNKLFGVSNANLIIGARDVLQKCAVDSGNKKIGGCILVGEANHLEICVRNAQQGNIGSCHI